MLPKVTVEPTTTAAANVHDAALGLFGAVWAITASLATATADSIAEASAADWLAGRPIPAGR